MGNHFGLQLTRYCNPCQLKTFEIVRIENPMWQHYIIQKSGLLFQKHEVLNSLKQEEVVHATKGGRTDEDIMEKYYSMVLPGTFKGLTDCFRTDYNVMKYSNYSL